MAEYGSGVGADGLLPSEKQPQQRAGLPCPDCGKLFANAGALKVHRKCKHPSEQPPAFGPKEERLRIVSVQLAAGAGTVTLGLLVNGKSREEIAEDAASAEMAAAAAAAHEAALVERAAEQDRRSHKRQCQRDSEAAVGMHRQPHRVGVHRSPPAVQKSRRTERGLYRRLLDRQLDQSVRRSFVRRSTRERFSNLRLRLVLDLFKSHALPTGQEHPYGRRCRIEEICTAGDLVFGLAESGICCGFERTSGRRTCTLNRDGTEVVRSLFHNKSNSTLITVSVYAADHYTTLRCRATPLARHGVLPTPHAPIPLRSHSLALPFPCAPLPLRARSLTRPFACPPVPLPSPAVTAPVSVRPFPVSAPTAPHDRGPPLRPSPAHPLHSSPSLFSIALPSTVGSRPSSRPHHAHPPAWQRRTHLRPCPPTPLHTYPRRFYVP